MSDAAKPSLNIDSVMPAGQGGADHIFVMEAGDSLSLCMSKKPRRPDNRDARSIMMMLSRQEALTLGRFLVAQAGGLVDLGCPTTDIETSLAVFDEDETGEYMGLLEAERVGGGDVLMTVRRLYEQSHTVDSTWIWVNPAEARSFALGLLALVQD